MPQHFKFLLVELHVVCCSPGVDCFHILLKVGYISYFGDREVQTSIISKRGEGRASHSLVKVSYVDQEEEMTLY